MQRTDVYDLMYPATEPKSLFSIWREILLGRNELITLYLEIPRHELLRLQTFVDDINELVEDEIDFSLEDLTGLLYNNLLHTARQGKLKLRPFADKIISLYNTYKAPVIKSTFEQIDDYRWTRVEKEIPRRKKFVPFPIQLHKKSVLRGDVLIMDIFKNQQLTIGITISELIALLLIEFSNEIEAGLSAKRIRSIIKMAQETSY